MPIKWPADRVERRPIDALIPDARNARTHSDAQVAQIAASMAEWGWTNPVLVDETGRIIAGHGRVLAARKLGLGEAPVMVAEGWTEAQKRAYVIADNQLAMNAGWDEALLSSEVRGLAEWDFDLSLLGFADIDALLASGNSGLTDPDDAPAPPAHPASALGDVWLLGRHRLVCGDSTEADTVAVALNGVSPNMVLTDPPYGMGLDTDFSGAKGSLKSAGRKSGTRGNRYEHVIGDHEDFSPGLIDSIFLNCPDVREVFLFGADYYAELLPSKNDGSWLVWDKRKESQSAAIGSEFELIWSQRKHKRRMLRHDWFGFLSSGNVQEARNRCHPAQKPSSLLKDIMEQWGRAGDVVADLYVGSGTTIIAAEMTGRACHAIELSPAYVDVAVRRWQNFTGERATLDGDGRTFDEIADERRPYDADADSLGSYHDAVAAVGKRVKAGEPVPAFFQPAAR